MKRAGKVIDQAIVIRKFFQFPYDFLFSESDLSQGLHFLNRLPFSFKLSKVKKAASVDGCF